MKAEYSHIHCPTCGSTAVRLTEADIFACEYCGTAFNYDLDHIEPSSANKILLEELRALFREREAQLKEEKSKNTFFLKYYAAKSAARIAKTLSAACLILSFACIFLIGKSPYFATGIVSGVSAFVAITLYRKKVYRKYHRYAMHYATKAAKLEEQICVYTKLLSRLSE